MWSMVAWKEARRWGGRPEMKPTVSAKTTPRPLGSRPPCWLTSSVANSRSIGAQLRSCCPNLEYQLMGQQRKDLGEALNEAGFPGIGVAEDTHKRASVHAALLPLSHPFIRFKTN